MRARVERIVEQSKSEPTYRVVEADGTPCDCWLPGLEAPDPEGVLDRGGFAERADAEAFALGVCWERAHHGLLPGVSTEDVDRERAVLDSSRAPRGARKRREVDPWDAEPAQLDLEALWTAVEKPQPIVITRRRKVA